VGFTLCQRLPRLASLSRCRPLVFDWCRAASSSHVVVVQLQGQLLAQERELHRKEGAIIAWEDRLVAFKRALGKVLAELDVGCV
jgi:hypothetical protein